MTRSGWICVTTLPSILSFLRGGTGKKRPFCYKIHVHKQQSSPEWPYNVPIALGKGTVKAASSLNGVGIRGKYLTSAPIPATRRGKKINHLFPSTPVSHIPFPATSQVHRYGLENQILVLLMNCLLSSFYHLSQEADRELGPNHTRLLEKKVEGSRSPGLAVLPFPR